jgi:hypothetical protein
MPLYFFHLRGSGPVADDAEGEEFPNDAAARQEAIAVAGDLARNRNVASDERLVVTDANGNVIHEESLVR